VDVVSSVDAYIDALQQQVAAARTARNAVLHELLTGGGDDWTETSLGELCEIYQPETISKAQMNDAAPYIVYGANGPVGHYSRFNHEEPEVVVTCRGATCGVVNMTPPNCWITGNAMVVRPRDERSTKGFLFWALQTSVDVSATISGSAQPQITRTGLAPSKIQVPPIAEQKRIVEIVSSMDDVIQAAERAVVEAKNLRSGLLSDLLSGEHEIPVSYDELLGAA
jgi:restriction endonuclease S subunit